MLEKIFSSSPKSAFWHHDSCYCGSTVPGKIITKSLGLMSMVIKGIAGDVTVEIKKLINQFVNHVEELGGNAIINFRIETGTYQQHGSAWQVTYILLYGEGVVLKLT